MMKNEDDGKTEQNRRRISSNVHSAADGTAGAVGGSGGGGLIQ